MEGKTNVMRLLDGRKLPYQPHTYSPEITNGIEVADLLGQPHERVLKTLVTVGKSGQHYVFMIPVASELNLKKAAAAAGEKSIEMIPAKQLLPLTGYIHGGCSPLGMKKAFPTFVDRSVESHESVMFSAGRVGFQVEAPLDTLRKAVPITFADLADAPE